LRTDSALVSLENGLLGQNSGQPRSVPADFASPTAASSTSIRYTERLSKNRGVASVGSPEDSYDNALGVYQIASTTSIDNGKTATVTDLPTMPYRGRWYGAYHWYRRSDA
jgi:hypothetical protein